MRPSSVASSMSFQGSTLSTLPEEDELLEVFQRYASFGTQDASALDNFRFAKLVAESRLDVSPTTADLIFTKAKEKGARKLSYRLFRLRAVPMLAEDTRSRLDDVIEDLVAVEGPRLGLVTRTNSTGVFDKLTDVNQYTGMYGSRFGKSASFKTPSPVIRSQTFQQLPEVDDIYVDDLRRVFTEFAAYGSGYNAQGEMDNVNFAKLCRDCGLLGPRLLARDVDMIFAKVKGREMRRINLNQFIGLAVPMLGTGHGRSLEDVCEAICAGQPTTNATMTRTNNGIFRRMTDEGHYTGMYASRFGRSPSKKSGKKDYPSTMPTVPQELVGDVSRTFKDFCWYGAGVAVGSSPPDSTLDNVKFAKLVRDSGLLRRRGSEPGAAGRTLTMTAADLVFTKSCPPGGRKINCSMFVRQTVPMLAHASGMDIATVSRIIANAQPVTNATQTRTDHGIFRKVTDESLYTGMYGERFGKSGMDEYRARILETTMAKGSMPQLPDLYHPAMKKAFRRYSSAFQGAMSEEDFCTMVYDAGLMDKKLTDDAASMVFHLCKEKYSGTLDYEDLWNKAIGLLSVAKEMDVHGVGKRLVEAQKGSGSRSLSRTSSASNRSGGTIFDKLADENRYTGMHRERFASLQRSSSARPQQRIENFAAAFQQSQAQHD